MAATVDGMASDDEVPERKRLHDEVSVISRENSSSDLFVSESPSRRSLERSDKRTKSALDSTASTTQWLNDTCSFAATEDIRPHHADRPRTPFYHPSRNLLEILVSGEITALAKVYEQHKRHGFKNAKVDAIITKLLLYADLVAIHVASLPAALIGNTGAGKSFLLSCIMDRPGIALDSIGADRGTNIPHQYLAFKASDKMGDGSEINGKKQASTTMPRYRARAVYHSYAQIRATVSSLCKDAFNFLDGEDEEEPSIKSETSGPSTVDVSKQAARRLYDSAVEWFFTMLCGELGFETKAEINRFFRRQHALRTEFQQHRTSPYTSEDDIFAQTVDELMAFIVELLQGRIETKDADNLPELQQLYKLMSTPESTLEPHPWRAMQNLSIFLEHDLLEAGAIIGDTAGLSDSDQNVVNGTTQYAKTAGFLVICSTLTRLKVDPALLDESISLVLSLGKARKTILVVTKIDMLRRKSSDEERETMDLLPEDTEALARAEREWIVLLSRHNDLMEEQGGHVSERDDLARLQTQLMASISTSGDMSLFEQFRTNASRIGELDVMIRAAQGGLEIVSTQIEVAQKVIGSLRLQAYNKIDQAAVLAYCRSMEMELIDKFRTYTGSSREPDLHVIFASGEQYGKHLQCLTGVEGPFLDLEATGIPELKRVLYNHAAGPNFQKSREIALSHTPRLINRAISALSPTQLPQMEEVRNSMHFNIADGIRSLLETVSSRVDQVYAAHVTAVFENKENIKAWNTKAKRVVAALPGQHHATTFKTFCGRNGRWVSLGQKCSWNPDIIEIYSDVVGPALDSFEDACSDIEREIGQKLAELFDHLRHALANSPCRDAEGYSDFLATIAGSQDDVLAQLGPLWATQIDSLLELRTDFLLDSEFDIRKSYVARVMSPVYSKANAIMTKAYQEVPRHERPQTAHRARFLTVKNGVLGTDPTSTAPGQLDVFEAVKNHADIALGEKRTSIVETLQAVLETGILHRIEEDFSSRYNVTPLGVEELSEASIELVAALQSTLKKLETTGKRLVAECEEWKRPAGGLY